MTWRKSSTNCKKLHIFFYFLLNKFYVVQKKKKTDLIIWESRVEDERERRVSEHTLTCHCKRRLNSAWVQIWHVYISRSEARLNELTWVFLWSWRNLRQRLTMMSACLMGTFFEWHRWFLEDRESVKDDNCQLDLHHCTGPLYFVRRFLANHNITML